MHSARLFILSPRAASDVTSHNCLDGKDVVFLDEHAAAVELVAVLYSFLGKGRCGQKVVGTFIAQELEPEA